MNPDRRNCLKALGTLVVATGSGTCLAKASTSHAQPFNFPGGVVDIRWPKASAKLPTVKFGLREPALFDLGTSWRCLVGLSLNTLPGEYVIYVKDNDSALPASALRFSVEQKTYPVYVTESYTPLYSQQIDKFSQLDFQNSVPPALPMQAPVTIEWQDTFGRIFVHQKDSQSGSSLVSQNSQTLTQTDLASEGVLVVVAPQNGIVSNLYPSPNRKSTDDESMRVIIDHGRGLYSCLDGVRDLTVKMGNGVVNGAVIGKVQRSETAVSSNAKGDQISLATLDPNQSVVEEDVVFRWYCVLNSAFVNPLILTKLD